MQQSRHHRAPARRWPPNAGAVLAFVTNRAWLRSKAYGHTGLARHATTDAAARQSSPSSEAATSVALTSPARRATGAFAASPSIPAPPALPLDINIATAAQLQAALGLDQASGDWLVATRTRLGQFSSVEQLLTVGQVPPHLYVRAEGKLMVREPVTRPAPGRRWTTDSRSAHGRALGSFPYRVGERIARRAHLHRDHPGESRSISHLALNGH
jgi:DNA uptake protein ComE-like DNA-binding protein